MYSPPHVLPCTPMYTKVLIMTIYSSHVLEMGPELGELFKFVLNFDFWKSRRIYNDSKCPALNYDPWDKICEKKSAQDQDQKLKLIIINHYFYIVAFGNILIGYIYSKKKRRRESVIMPSVRTHLIQEPISLIVVFSLCPNLQQV